MAKSPAAWCWIWRAELGAACFHNLSTRHSRTSPPVIPAQAGIFLITATETRRFPLVRKCRAGVSKPQAKFNKTPFLGSVYSAPVPSSRPAARMPPRAELVRDGCLRPPRSVLDEIEHGGRLVAGRRQVPTQRLATTPRPHHTPEKPPERHDNPSHPPRRPVRQP
jgi:hypothetical protein